MYETEALDETLNLELHYVDSPKDKTILVCHGFGSRGRGGNIVANSFIEQLPVNVATFCFPSHKSNRLSGFAHDYKGIMQAESCLTKHLGATDITYFGLSYGAFVVLDYFAHHSSTQKSPKVILGAPYLGNQTFNGISKLLFQSITSVAYSFELQTMPYDRMKGSLRQVNVRELMDFCVRDVPKPSSMQVLGLHTAGHTVFHNFFARDKFENYVNLYGGKFIELEKNELADKNRRGVLAQSCSEIIF
jgi:hypothetical protein